MVDAADLQPSLTTTHTTADPTKAVQLINGNVECTSCHSPHVQSIDRMSQNFLVRTAPMARCAWPATHRSANGQWAK